MVKDLLSIKPLRQLAKLSGLDIAETILKPAYQIKMKMLVIIFVPGTQISKNDDNFLKQGYFISVTMPLITYVSNLQGY